MESITETPDVCLSEDLYRYHLGSAGGMTSLGRRGADNTEGNGQPRLLLYLCHFGSVALTVFGVAFASRPSSGVKC